MNIAESIVIVTGASSGIILDVRLFPAIADRLFGSEQGQARLHING